MDLIDEVTRNQLRQRLAGLAAPVELRLYRKADSGRLVLPAGAGCATCDTTEELLRLLVDASTDRITLSVIDVSASGDSSIYVPSVTVASPGEEPRITFQGLPAGYEFATLLDAIERVSADAADLAPESSQELARLDEDVEGMVFVTPTCPYCPGAASLANRMAITPRVRSVVVEANEFDSLSRRFGVQGVPKTVVNRSGGFEGALPEKRFVQAVLQLAGKSGERFVSGGNFE